ncbi:MAG TPA: CinA family protein [Streptosporangiaceae bacterium]|nr:CinA family protein [Streptosporangiaceae bacterium]
MSHERGRTHEAAAEANAAEPTAAELARRIVEVLTARGESVAVAESLTGGLVAGELTSVPGASVVVRGGVVAYATELKTELLGVPAALLARRGPVDPDVAAAMAAGVRARLGASYGISTTGVAGPGPADGKPAGTVFIAVDGPTEPAVRGLQIAGDRQQVRFETVRAVLALLAAAMREDAI